MKQITQLESLTWQQLKLLLNAAHNPRFAGPLEEAKNQLKDGATGDFCAFMTGFAKVVTKVVKSPAANLIANLTPLDPAKEAKLKKMMGAGYRPPKTPVVQGGVGPHAIATKVIDINRGPIAQANQNFEPQTRIASAIDLYVLQQHNLSGWQRLESALDEIANTPSLQNALCAGVAKQLMVFFNAALGGSAAQGNVPFEVTLVMLFSSRSLSDDSSNYGMFGKSHGSGLSSQSFFQQIFEAPSYIINPNVPARISVLEGFLGAMVHMAQEIVAQSGY